MSDILLIKDGDNIMDVLVIKPEAIKDFLQQEVADIEEIDTLKERDFVKDVRKYLDSIGNRVLLVTGLRSTGKTIGILQGIKDTDTTYICPAYKDSCNAEGIRKLIKTVDSRNIVIDEYSWITDEEQELAGFIAGLSKLGRKIILTGTESSIIHGLQSSELIHRAIEIHTNYCSYEEYRRLFSLEESPDSLLRYLQTGGIFESKIDEAKGNMRDYIKNAIIDNIAFYYPEADTEQVKMSVYTYFYNCITENYKPIALPVYNYDREMLSYEEYLEDFGIRTDIKLDESVFRKTSDLLEALQIAVRLRDLRINSHMRIYIVNQAISYQLVKAIYRLDAVSDKYLGHLYEAAVVCNFYFSKPKIYDMYFLEGRKCGIDYEIDFILKEKYTAYIFECKYSKNDRFQLSETASIAKDIIPNLLGDCDVSGRFVIYQGEDKTGVTNNKDIIYTNDWNIDYESFDNLLEDLKDKDISVLR